MFFLKAYVCVFCTFDSPLNMDGTTYIYKGRRIYGKHDNIIFLKGVN